MNQTPRHGHAPIKMRRVSDSARLRHRGDFCWQVGESGKRTLVVMIPGERNEAQYSRWTIGHKNHCGASWSWNGNLDVPTLKPSLHAVGEWHGFIRNGFLVEA